mmetsp:Transcript_57293/g.64037  ORF Transcript_57293/g.64037 Transcript_57293/m.64037 type:complete len:104 (+) Transcript_57293:349-660(+)
MVIRQYPVRLLHVYLIVVIQMALLLLSFPYFPLLKVEWIIHHPHTLQTLAAIIVCWGTENSILQQTNNDDESCRAYNTMSRKKTASLVFLVFVCFPVDTNYTG